MSENAKALAGRAVDAYNTHDVEAFAAFYAPDVVIHNVPSVVPPGREGLVFLMKGQFEAFPDEHLTVDEILAERDLIVLLWSSTGTHTGPLMGIPPTGKKVTNSGISIFRLADGKVVDSWLHQNMFAVMEQLGVVSAAGG